MNRILFWILFIAVTSSLRAETPGIPIISQQPLDLTITNGGPATFSVDVSGTGPFTYQWQFNGTNLTSNITKVAGAVVNLVLPSQTYKLLDSPSGVALDRSGNLFFSDDVANRICKVDTDGIITTVAGSRTAGFSGDGAPAIGAAFRYPRGVALDASGNLFIADYGNNRIRKVDTQGIVTTVVGNGASTYSGDGGLATNAGLGAPQSVALDKAGILYIGASSRIRRVDTNGVITTIAGGGAGGDGGLAINASLRSPQGIAFDGLGNLFIADYDRIRKVDSLGIIRTVAGGGPMGNLGDGIAATNAYFSTVAGVALDGSGNLFIPDNLNGRIRKVDPEGIITTIAGSGVAPRGITVDDAGNLLIADTFASSILKVNLGTTPKLFLNNAGPKNAGNYSVIVRTPDGVATSQVATLTVLMPPSIASQPTNQIVPPGGTATFTVSASGDGTLSYCWLRNGAPISLANGSSYSVQNAQGSDSGTQFRCVVSNAYGSVTSYVATLFVAIPPTITQQPVSRFVTNGNTAVFSIAASGMGPLSYQWQRNGTDVSPIITTVAGNGTQDDSGDGGPATNAGVGLLQGGIALDSAGNLFISDNNCIRKVDASGTITTVAGNRNTRGYSGDGGPATGAQLNSVLSIVSDGLGNLFFSDQSDRCIRKVDASGIISTVAGSGSGYYGDGGPATSIVWFSVGAALGSSGDLLLTDYRNNLIRRVNASGTITSVAGNGLKGYSGDGGPATSAGLNYPRKMAVDSEGNMWIADLYNYRVRKVDGNGIITTVAGNGMLGYSGDGGPATNASLTPTDIAVDGAGNLLITDSGNGRIRKVDAAGMITTVAGDGTRGYSGDGGPATSAQLSPGSVALDGSGNLYFADIYNLRVRKVNYLFGATPTLVLTNVDLAKAGDYSVIVRSPYGCVTSSVVSLSVWSVQPPQEFTGVLTEGKNLSLQFRGTPSYPYVLQTATNLTPPVIWQAVGTNLTDADGVWRFGVTVTNADSPARFYRVLGE